MISSNKYKKKKIRKKIKMISSNKYKKKKIRKKIKMISLNKYKKKKIRKKIRTISLNKYMKNKNRATYWYYTFYNSFVSQFFREGKKNKVSKAFLKAFLFLRFFFSLKSSVLKKKRPLKKKVIHGVNSTYTKRFLKKKLRIKRRVPVKNCPLYVNSFFLKFKKLPLDKNKVLKESLSFQQKALKKLINRSFYNDCSYIIYNLWDTESAGVIAKKRLNERRQLLFGRIKKKKVSNTLALFYKTCDRRHFSRFFLKLNRLKMKAPQLQHKKGLFLKGVLKAKRKDLFFFFKYLFCLFYKKKFSSLTVMTKQIKKKTFYLPSHRKFPGNLNFISKLFYKGVLANKSKIPLFGKIALILFQTLFLQTGFVVNSLEEHKRLALRYHYLEDYRW